MTSSSLNAPTRRRWLWIVGASTLVVLILAALGIWWYLRDDAPPAVTLDAAVESLDTTVASEDTATTEPPATTGAPTSAPPPIEAPSAIAGTWTVDTSIGEFDFESATGSFVGFRVQEELTIGSQTAVGRTGDVTGTITIDGTTLTETTVEADLTGLTTNESRRDNRVRDALEIDQFPTASFELTEPVDLGAAAGSGEPVSIVATGELTIHGITQPVAFPLDALLVDGVVVAVGSVDIVFADYGVTPPSAPVVLSVDDEGVLELQLLFSPT